MKAAQRKFFWVAVVLMLGSALNAQQPLNVPFPAVVPPLVNFSGKATDAQGKAVSGIAGVTFAIYKDQSGGTPLWLETQNVQADAKGNYTVQLGATKPDGLSLDLINSGDARWLGATWRRPFPETQIMPPSNRDRRAEAEQCRPPRSPRRASKRRIARFRLPSEVVRLGDAMTCST
jgi:hypothetical protein